MLEKNKDTLQKDLLVLSESSKQKLMNVLFPPSEGDQKTSKVTLGGQFRKQLDSLMTALNATEPHYIRSCACSMRVSCVACRVFSRFVC